MSFAEPFRPARRRATWMPPAETVFPLAPAEPLMHTVIPEQYLNVEEAVAGPIQIMRCGACGEDDMLASIDIDEESEDSGSVSLICKSCGAVELL